MPAQPSGPDSAAFREGPPREIRAPGPGPHAEELRRAYLELLKLCLCDLGAPSTTSVDGLAAGHLVSRELSGGQLQERAEGRDWPLRGLTMTGLRRLDDLQSCVESVVREGVAGDLIETGAWRGGSSILMRATLDSLGAHDRTLWVADSFAGFPRAARETDQDAGDPNYPASLGPYLAVFDFLAAPLEEVRANFERFGCERGTEFVPGFLEDTLPDLPDRQWSLVRLDTDAYDSTLLALRYLYPYLALGGHLIVDDYGALDECRAAVEHFRGEYGIREPLQQVDWACVRWRRVSDSPIESVPERRRLQPMATRAVPRSDHRHVPTRRELELSGEAAELRDRLADAVAELARAKEFERQLHEVTTSRSWRLTKPLRELNPRRRRLSQ
jgi:Macrocin-O-methyltransferase (TylF)